MSVDCFHSPAIECFPSTSSEVFTKLAFCNALATEIVAANTYSYENAFCTKSRCLTNRCGSAHLGDEDNCDFSCIAKKYANKPNCLYGCCLDPYATSVQNGSGYYSCSNPISTSNAAWTKVRDYVNKYYPKASDYSCI